MRWRVMAGVVLLGVSGALLAADGELGYADPVGGVPWHPPVLRDTQVSDQERAREAREASEASRQRCLQRSATHIGGDKLMCSTRSTLDAALRASGALPLPHLGQKDVLVYRSDAVWPGSAYVSVGFTGQRFAVADIAYAVLPGWYDQLYAQLVQQYGKPTRVEGRPDGPRGVMWKRGDSIQIWLHQPTAAALLVSYVRPDMYQYWTRPKIQAGK